MRPDEHYSIPERDNVNYGVLKFSDEAERINDLLSELESSLVALSEALRSYLLPEFINTTKYDEAMEKEAGLKPDGSELAQWASNKANQVRTYLVMINNLTDRIDR